MKKTVVDDEFKLLPKLPPVSLPFVFAFELWPYEKRKNVTTSTGPVKRLHSSLRCRTGDFEDFSSRARLRACEKL